LGVAFFCFFFGSCVSLGWLELSQLGMLVTNAPSDVAPMRVAPPPQSAARTLLDKRFDHRDPECTFWFRKTQRA
jgi:hypothetical protein